MSYTIQMQDWVTVRGALSTTVVLQPESDYLDLSVFQDFASYIEISEIVGTGASVKLQTAPVKEETYFQDLVTESATGVRVTVVRWSAASTAPARWLRWKCSATGASWTVTFRIHLNANPGGSTP